MHLRPFSTLRALLLAAIALAVLAPAAPAQLDGEGPRFFDFDAGDIHYRTHFYCWFWDKTAPQICLVPGEYLGGEVFLETAYGEPGWSKLLQERGHNVYSLDMVGGHNTDPLPGNDLVTLIDKGQWGVYQMGMGIQPHVFVGQGIHAAYLIKAKSMDPLVAMAAVLIDPVGPQGAQPRLEITTQEALARERSRRDRLWVEWGLGPRPGELRPGVDLDAEGFEALMERVDPAQPPYWVGPLTGLDCEVVVNEPMHLAGWPVLVVRTPAASAEQLAREESVVAWLEERGVEVDRLDLGQVEGLSGLTAMPMAGRLAEEALDAIWPWMQEQLARPHIRLGG